MKIFSHIKKHSVPLSTLLVVFVIVASFALKIRSSNAAIGLPFGGMITDEMPCTCSPGVAYFVAGPGNKIPGYYVFTPGTVPYAWYMFFSESWILGAYLPGVQSCWMLGDPCYPLPDVIGTISMAGTSL